MKRLSAILVLGLMTAACNGTAGPAPSPSPAGPLWRLMSLNGQAPVTGTQITLTIAADGRASGSAGCNRYFGSAKFADGVIGIQNVGSTKMYCVGDGIMAQEGAFLTALQAAKAYSVDGSVLTLKSADGGSTVTFEK